MELKLSDCTGAVLLKHWAMEPHKVAMLRCVIANMCHMRGAGRASLLWRHFHPGSVPVHSNHSEGVYVDAVGTYKKIKDVLCVVLQHVEIVTDFNQVTHHMLDALHVHLVNTRGPVRVGTSFECPVEHSFNASFPSVDHPSELTPSVRAVCMRCACVQVAKPAPAAATATSGYGDSGYGSYGAGAGSFNAMSSAMPGASAGAGGMSALQQAVRVCRGE